MIGRGRREEVAEVWQKPQNQEGTLNLLCEKEKEKFPVREKREKKLIFEWNKS